MQNKDTLHSAAKLYGRVCIIGAISSWIGLKNGAVSCPTHTKSLKKSLYIWHCWWVQSCPTVNLCIYKMQRIALWLCWHASLAKCSDRRFLFETTDHLSDCNTSYTVSTCTIFVHKAPAIYPQTPPSDAASLETFKTQIEMSPHCHLTGLFTVHQPLWPYLNFMRLHITAFISYPLQLFSYKVCCETLMCWNISNFDSAMMKPQSHHASSRCCLIKVRLLFELRLY